MLARTRWFAPLGVILMAVLAFGGLLPARVSTAETAVGIAAVGTGPAALVKDIKPGTEGSAPTGFAAIGNTLYFIATTPATGAELWRSDGTAAGTQLVKDIYPGEQSAFVNPVFSNLINANGTLFFFADDGVHGYELWRSDGTEAGTTLTADLNPGASSFVNPNGLPPYMIPVGNTVYFVANESLYRSDGTEAGTIKLTTIAVQSHVQPAAVNGIVYFASGSTDFMNGTTDSELWRTDGTVANTIRVRDINPGGAGSNPNLLTNVNGTLYFRANDGTSGVELWRSDGTEGGTVRVRDINPGAASGDPGNLADVNGTLFFSANDGTTGYELWRSDGTESGTTLVRNIAAGANGSLGQFYNSNGYFTNVNGTLYFAADDGISGTELWRSDGTDLGTTLVRDINPGAAHSGPYYMTNVSGTLFFTANDGSSGYELWKSDGTEAGTVRVRDINPGAGSAGIRSNVFARLTNVSGMLFFAANNGISGHELWKSDGSEAGTVLVADLNTRGASSNCSPYQDLNGILLMLCRVSPPGSFLHINDLWRSDGTEAGTSLISANNPTYLTNVAGTLFFAAGTSGQLWKSDGTTAGTTLVRNINPGYSSMFPAILNLTNVNGTLFFTGSDDYWEHELWKSDGTEAGTVRVRDIRIGTQGSFPGNLTNVNGTLFFTANDGTSGFELWKSDGTAAGTVRVRDINPGFTGSSPNNLINVNGTLYFTADDGTSGVELWRSDGTEAGTVRLRDINPGTASSNPTSLFNANGTLFFLATDANGTELWKSDGSEASTVRVRDINPGAGSAFGSFSSLFRYVNGSLFFAADDGTSGTELWKSDGTEAGTVLIRDINPGAGSSTPRHLTNVNGILYFAANDGSSGYELWKSDGAESGTVRVRDINTGANSSQPGDLVNVNGTLYFTADNGTNGVELWRSDGTEAGTVMVQDIAPGNINSNPARFTVSNNRLFFSAYTEDYGTEIWSANVADLLRYSSAPITTVGGSLNSAGGQVQVTFPAGSVAGTVTATVADLAAPSQPLPSGRQALRAFSITVLNSAGQQVTQFSPPLTIVVNYTDAELAAAGLTEATLNLAYWNGSAWSELLPCAGCSFDTLNNRIAVTLDHLTEFAVLGNPQIRVFLPLTVR
jgi:ELWxxDGT repeat protein